MSSSTSLRGACLMLLAAAAQSAAMAQQVAGSVESGLQNLAQEIVTKSVAQDRNSIAVLPFPNSDGSCSVLSTYLADELIQALFSIPDSPLTIIERNQLEAIVNEIQIGAGGLLNPETTQSLGKVSGVKALTVGTITQIGDRIRINARLVATDTGRTISAAAVSIPRTSDVDSLLRQPVPGEGGTCGVQIAAHASPQSAAGSSVSSVTRVSSNLASGPGIPGTRPTVVGNLQATVESVSRNASKNLVSVVVKVVNTGKDPIRVILTQPKPTVIDDTASHMEATVISGVGVCNQFAWTAYDCKVQYASLPWTMLYPDSPVTMLYGFEAKDGDLSGRTLSFAANFLQEPDKDERDSETARKQISGVSLGFSNVPIGNGQR